MPKGRVSTEYKNKSKCSLRKQAALPCITITHNKPIYTGFITFFKSKYLKAEIRRKQLQEKPGFLYYSLLLHVSINKNII